MIWLLELSINDHFDFPRSVGFGWRWFPRPTSNWEFNLDWCKSKEYKEKLKKNVTALRIINNGVSKSIYPRICGVIKQKMHERFCKRSFKPQIKPSLLSFKICGETLIIWEGKKLDLSKISIRELQRLLIKSRAMKILFKRRN